MTTIAVKDGVVASDSQITSSNTGSIYHVDKIIQAAGGTVFGGYGDWAKAYAMMQWLMGGQVGDAPNIEEAAVLKVGKDGVIHIMEDTPVFFPLLNKYTAVGSGAAEAVMAMRFGATAEEAVRAVMDQNAFTGLPVLTLRYY